MSRPSRSHTFDPLQPAMVLVAGGPFTMGTHARELRVLTRQARGDRVEWYAREQPAHTVTLPDFYIGRYPVTVGEFAAFIHAGGYENPALWSETGWRWRTYYRIAQPEYWDDERWSGQAGYPVVGLSWYTAQAYCAWLRSETGQPYRLPTEAEWEKAARGPDGRRYPWGNRWEPGYCNVAPLCIDTWDGTAPPNRHRLTPVGQYSPQGDSPYGCADMAGNIWEWCQSSLRPYPLTPETLREAPSDGEAQIVRGGSWYHGPDDARCAARYCYYPHGRDNVVGFRLAL